LYSFWWLYSAGHFVCTERWGHSEVRPGGIAYHAQLWINLKESDAEVNTASRRIPVSYQGVEHKKEQ
jgi:hypothetical protein